MKSLSHQPLIKVFYSVLTAFLAVTLLPPVARGLPWQADESFGEHRATKKGDIEYLIWFPKTYKANARQRFPLLLFLHGADGSNTRHHPTKYAHDENFPFIVVAPHLRSTSWRDADLDGLLREVSSQNPIDADRIYVTGYSMGGFGVWELLSEHPEWFAAAVPIAGGGDANRICRARKVPVWAFHGDRDEVVPLSQSEEMISALKNCGGEARLTVYPGVGHPSWVMAYKDPELYKWLLAQHRERSAGSSRD